MEKSFLPLGLIKMDVYFESQLYFELNNVGLFIVINILHLHFCDNKNLELTVNSGVLDSGFTLSNNNERK